MVSSAVGNSNLAKGLMAFWGGKVQRWVLRGISSASQFLLKGGLVRCLDSQRAGVFNSRSS